MKTITIYFFIAIINCSLFAQSTIIEEDFESASFPPEGWVTFRGTDNIGTENDWETISVSNTGSSAAFSRHSEIGVGIAEDWLVTSLIDLTNSVNTVLTFYSKEQYNTTYMSQYEIRVSTDSQTMHSDFTTITAYSDFALDYQQYSIDLSAYDGQQIYIAFVHVDEYEDNWFLDDITVSGDTGCMIMSSTAQGLSGNQFYGQTFTAECSGFLEYVQINLLPNQSGIITGSTLEISEGNFIGLADYAQDFEDIIINNGDHLRIYLNEEFEIIEGNQYAFETYVANLNVSLDITDTFPNGNLIIGHGSSSGADLGFEVKISGESTLNLAAYEKDALLLFPNPTTNYISVLNLNSEEHYIIFDVLGKKVSSGTLSPNSQISVNNLEKGIYFLKLDGHKASKFLKN